MHLARIVLLVLLFLLLHAALHARQVEVIWQMQADETLEQGKQRATDRAWAQAVLEESLEQLPGELAPERKEVLAAYLAPHAERFILDSSEVRLSENVQGMLLGLEVAVDTTSLRQLLQRIGVFYTAGAKLPYSLQLGEKVPEDSTQEIARLELLTGVRQETGAVPSLKLDHDGATWKGVIDAARSSYDVAGSDLETLWLALWGWYFSTPGLIEPGDQNQQGLQQAQLEVRGWPAPDGLYEFDELLKGFRPALAGAVLKTLAMRADGVMGVWELTLSDVAGFRQRMTAYMQGRELQWELQGEAQQEQTPVSGEQAPPQAAPPSLDNSGSLDTALPRESAGEMPVQAPQQATQTPDTAHEQKQPASAAPESEEGVVWEEGTPLPPVDEFPALILEDE